MHARMQAVIDGEQAPPRQQRRVVGLVGGLHELHVCFGLVEEVPQDGAGDDVGG